MMSKYEWGVRANVKWIHRFLRRGARVLILNPNGGGGGESVFVRGIARGGRQVHIWVRAVDLENFRGAWVPTEEGRLFETREKADEWAKRMNETYGNLPHRERIS